MTFRLSVIKNPAGTFHFVGTVPLDLAMVNKDGSRLSPEEARRVAYHSNPGWISKTRVFRTVEEALQAAAELGISMEAIDIKTGNKGA